MQYRARFVLPITAPPIRDGWVAVDDGIVEGVGGGPGPQAAERDLGSVALLPGLVNAHTHLELSHLHGAIPRSADFVSWARGIIASRRERPDPRTPDIVDAIDRGIAESLAAGTAALGDISNTLVSVERLVQTPLFGVVFHELLRFNAPDPDAVVAEALARVRALPRTDRLRTTLAAHAPYSVAPSVLRAIRRAVEADAALGPVSIHLAESRAEVDFVATGTGPWRALLEQIGSWDASWRPAGATPVAYADAHGWLDDRTVVVHGVQMSPADLATVAARGATLVTCPRSNEHTGAGRPPVEAFYASGVRVAVGTDSLASAPDLNVFAELAALRRLAPGVPPRLLLDSATRQGAAALGFGRRLGAIESGFSARLIAVQVPPAVDDVEEYLVGGITPDQIAWVG